MRKITMILIFCFVPLGILYVFVFPYHSFHFGMSISVR